MKELISLIEKTDTAQGAELTELYQQIISAWKALNNERSKYNGTKIRVNADRRP